MASKTKGFLQLMRPANCVTAVADVLAGIAISGYFSNNIFSAQQIIPVALLALSTFGLYGGGVVFNDVFDAALDKIERPERPIPSGLIPLQQAASLGTLLLLAGIGLALLVNTTAGLLAISVALSAVVYNKWGKHQKFFGPINMGLCRGLNLLLGISIVPVAVHAWWFLAVVPIVYIAAITMISRGEVFGGRKPTLYFAGFLYFLVTATIAWFAFSHKQLWAMVFVLAFGFMICTPLQKAIQHPIGPNIGKAVKAGVLALILMDAAWATAFGAIYLAIVIILLLPLSLKLAKVFAVT